MKLVSSILFVLALIGFGTASWAGCDYHKATITYTPVEDKEAVTAAPAPVDQEQPLVADIKQPQESDSPN